MILHWGSPQPGLCSHPCCSSASPPSITHRCHWELVQSPAKTWAGRAGGFTSSPCDCKSGSFTSSLCDCRFVNNWEVRMIYLFIYSFIHSFKIKSTFPVGAVPGRGCHLEVSWLWHWGSCAHQHSSLCPNSAPHWPQPGMRNFPKTPRKCWFVNGKSLRLAF